MSAETNREDCRRPAYQEDEDRRREYLESAKCEAANIRACCEAILEENDEDTISELVKEIEQYLSKIKQ
jgi:SpoVK/Ycf46/Vps4 family AAA+-type ATPase